MYIHLCTLRFHEKFTDLYIHFIHYHVKEGEIFFPKKGSNNGIDVKVSIEVHWYAIQITRYNLGRISDFKSILFL